jgi:hypothetical protein
LYVAPPPNDSEPSRDSEPDDSELFAVGGGRLRIISRPDGESSMARDPRGQFQVIAHEEWILTVELDLEQDSDDEEGAGLQCRDVWYPDNDTIR